MNKRLAIKGHPTRGKEVIELLEMLGGINRYNLRGSEDEWFVLNGTLIQRSDRLFAEKGFTLEEFLEKFPYKVGDKVSSKYLKNYKIEKMEWEDTNSMVIYKLQGMGWYRADELQPYKQETMEEIKIDIPKGYEFAGVDDDKQQVVFTNKKEHSSEECRFIYSLVPYEEVCEPDYWTKLKHQYAGMAMQGFCANPECILLREQVCLLAVKYAHSLVNEIKIHEEEELNPLEHKVKL